MNTVPIKLRVERNSVPEPNTGCWIWVGACSDVSKGRPRAKMTIAARPTTAARVVYEEYVGPITDGLHVLHKCDNPLCVNPDHLYLGSHSDNMRDLARSARARRPRLALRGGRYCYRTSSGRYRAQVRFNSKIYHLGTFATKVDAAEAVSAFFAARSS